MAEKCHRCGKSVFAAERPVRQGGLVFHPGCFTCKSTGVLLTLKMAKTAIDPETGSNEIYKDGKQPGGQEMSASALTKPSQVGDVIKDRVGAVPDANMRTTDRKFNVAGKAAARGCTDADAGSNYGTNAVALDTQTNAPKPPTNVDNINQQEQLHNGVDKYTNADGTPVE